MGLDFYMLDGSAPCSIVQMTAKAVGVELNLKPVDLFTGEHLKPEYLKVETRITFTPNCDDHFGFLIDSAF